MKPVTLSHPPTGESTPTGPITSKTTGLRERGPRYGDDSDQATPTSAEVSRQDLEAQRGRPRDHVNAWWTGLTPEQQEQIIYDFPDLIGLLPGVPDDDRDTANRIALDRHRQELRARAEQINARLALLSADPGSVSAERRISEPEIRKLRVELAEIGAKQATFNRVDATLTGLGMQGLLLTLDVAGTGKAIVAVGDPDSGLRARYEPRT